MLYLLHYQLLPEKRLAVLMTDLFGVKLVTATIARISNDCAERFHGFVDALRDQVAAAPVKHMDETGFRIGGKTQWLHIASTAWLTFYRTAAKRGSLLANVTGIVVHDHWKPYYTMTGVVHALCNAHHLRELKALIEIEKEDWAAKMQRLLRRACHAANLARERGVPLKPGLIALIERCDDGILANGLAFHEAQPTLAKAKRRGRQPRRVGHNLLLRLSTRKQDVLRFLTDPSVPFTNNLAERDGRMMKLRQKISGGFRAENGAKDFAVIRSVLSTARKQGWNMLRTLTVSDQLGRSHQFTQLGEEFLLRGAYGDVTVGGLKALIGRTAAMRLTDAVRARAGGEVVRRFVNRQGRSGLQQRRFDVLTLASAVPRLDGGQHAEGQEHAGSDIGNRDRQTVRRAVGGAVGAHEARHRLGDQIKTAARAIRAGLAKPGDRRQNQPLIALVQGGPAKTEPVEDAGTVVFNQDVGLVDQL